MGVLLLLFPVVTAGHALFGARSAPPAASEPADAGLTAAVAAVAYPGEAWAAAAATPVSTGRPRAPSTGEVAPAAPDFAVSGAGVPAPAAAPAPRPPLAVLDASLPAWVRNVRETGLWSGARDGILFNKVPEGSTLRVVGAEAGRLRVFYSGDRTGRTPGEAWANAADLAPMPWPGWVRVRGPAALYAEADPQAEIVRPLRRGEYVEVLDRPTGFWARAFVLGEGREPPAEGWVAASQLSLVADAEQLTAYALTRELLARGAPEAWLKVPHQSQLDGTPYAAANCGPTSVAMLLEGFGIKADRGELRKQVLALQGDDGCDDCGVYIQYLAGVVEQHGLKVVKLRDPDASEKDFHRWALDEIRAEVRSGRPVLPQVFYRRLPGRAASAYWGDHFVVVHGLLGDDFLINDPIDNDGSGYSRVMTAQMLDLAMKESDFPYAAFAVSR